MTDHPLIESYIDKGVLKYKTERLDEFAAELYPECKLDTGVRWARWIMFGEIKDESFVSIATEELEASAHFTGRVMGKPMTVLFFGDLFVDRP